MNRHLLPALALLLAGLAAASSASPLAGTWRVDPARSTELSPWREIVLTLRVSGDRVRLQRDFSAGRRTFQDAMELDVAAATNVVPVSWWPDNRHLGAYIGGDRTKSVRAAWLDDRRILRLSTDLVLATAQGERAVNILSDYKVSANGAVLTVTELRSTRNQPVVHTFTRVPAAP
jgi:hypothetical protein